VVVHVSDAQRACGHAWTDLAPSTTFLTLQRLRC
jgi:hypothetical protein